jgi:hypothetical protein
VLVLRRAGVGHSRSFENAATNSRKRPFRALGPEKHQRGLDSRHPLNFFICPVRPYPAQACARQPDIAPAVFAHGAAPCSDSKRIDPQPGTVRDEQM